MILLSWGVLRWQVLENSVPSVQASAEESYSGATPVRPTSDFPAVSSQDFRTRPIQTKRVVYSRFHRAYTIGVQSVRTDAELTSTLPKLSALQRVPISLAPNQVYASRMPLQQASFALKALPAQPSEKPRTLSVSYWMLIRSRASRSEIVNNGQIGASQGGIRLRAPIASFQRARQLSLSARMSQPLKQGEVAEGSLGASLLIGKRIPVEFLAERRFRLGQSNGSAWSLTASTGLSEFKLAHMTELDGYVQLGVVGARSRRPFIGGNAVFSRPLLDFDRGKVRIGVGIWGDAQRGAARLDIGPDLTIKSSLAGTSLRLSGQWRVRVAGEAKPSSGPAIVIGGDL